MTKKKFSHNEHKIDESLIDPDALRILDRLCDAGFEAYLVGGSVRDLLSNVHPKDFDISTSAKPEEIKRLFPRNCWLIGRRFRLAHVRFGHKIFELSTFRAGNNKDNLIVRDNRFGTPEQDALRRDFTINGLFYDHSQQMIIDYVGGWEDIHNKVLRAIGEPNTRFKQDPVRMIRLLKFSARLGFKIHPSSQEALELCLDEITKSAPARVLEEILRMLESGAASDFFELMSSSGILEHLFPTLTHFIKGKYGKEIFDYLEAADTINREKTGKPLDRAIMCACLLYPILVREIEVQFLKKNEIPRLGAILMLISSLIHAFVISSFSHFPKKLSSTIHAILINQYRLTPLSGKKHPYQKMLKSKEFGLSLKFLKVRSLVDNSLEELYNYWKQFYKT